VFTAAASVSNALAVGVGNLDEEGCWHLAAASLAPLPGSGKDDGGGQVDDEEMEALMARAEKLEEGVAAKFTERLEKRNSAEARWLQLSRQSGTTSDKARCPFLICCELTSHRLGGGYSQRYSLSPSSMCQWGRRGQSVCGRKGNNT
jgi:hypothetical protein